jgi:DNA-binding HxlR family transcriptional regulator
MSEDSGSHYTDEAEEQLEKVTTFLSRAGAIGILIEIDHTGGKQFTDLNEAIPVSSSTLSNRLQEAIELGILKQDLADETHNNSKIYVQTKLARRLHQRIKQQQLARIYSELQTLQEEFDEEVEDLQKWMYEEIPHATTKGSSRSISHE